MARSVPKIDVAARLIALGQAQPEIIPNEPAFAGGGVHLVVVPIDA
ncbi:hypothetical protein [Mesorhizobium sp. WSM1497]|nr:hypothetical protein [Mesorhizobium sp. WSM1497]